MLRGRPKILVLNKEDLCDPRLKKVRTCAVYCYYVRGRREGVVMEGRGILLWVGKCASVFFVTFASILVIFPIF